MGLILKATADVADVLQNYGRMGDSLVEMAGKGAGSFGDVSLAVNNMSLEIKDAIASSLKETGEFKQGVDAIAAGIAELATKIPSLKVKTAGPGLSVVFEQEAAKSREIITKLVVDFVAAYKDGSEAVKSELRKVAAVHEKINEEAGDLQKRTIEKFSELASKDLEGFLKRMTMAIDKFKLLAEVSPEPFPAEALASAAKFETILKGTSDKLVAIELTLKTTDFGTAAIQRGAEATTGFRDNLSETSESLLTIGKRADTELNKISAQFKGIKTEALSKGVKELKHNFEEFGEALPTVSLTTATGKQREMTSVFSEFQTALVAVRPDLVTIATEYKELADTSGLVAKQIGISKKLYQQGIGLTALGEEIRNSGADFSTFTAKLSMFAAAIPKAKIFDPLRTSVYEVLKEVRKGELVTQFSDRIQELIGSVSGGQIKTMDVFRVELGKVINESAALGPAIEPTTRAAQAFLTSLGDVTNIQSAYADLANLNAEFKESVNIEKYAKQIEEAGNKITELESKDLSKLKKGFESLGTPKTKEEVEAFTREVRKLFLSLDPQPVQKAAEITDKLTIAYAKAADGTKGLTAGFEKLGAGFAELEGQMLGVVAAIQRGHEATASFREELAETAVSISGLGDKAQQITALGTAFEQIKTEALSKGIQELEHNFDEYGKTTATTEQIMEGWRQGQTSTTMAFSSLRGELKNADPALKTIADDYENLSNAAADLGVKVDITQELNQQGNALKQLSATAVTSGQSLSEVAQMLDDIATSMASAKTAQATKPLQDALRGISEEVKKAVVIKEASSWVDDFLASVSTGKIKNMNQFRDAFGEIVAEMPKLGPAAKSTQKAAEDFLASISNVKDIKSATAYLGKLNETFKAEVNVKKYAKEIDGLGDKISGISEADLIRLKKGLESLGTPKTKEDVAAYAREFRKLTLNLGTDAVTKATAETNKLADSFEKGREGAKGLAAGFEKGTTIASRLGAGFSDLQKAMSGVLIWVGIAQSVRFFLMDVANAFITMAKAVAEAAKTEDLIRAFKNMSMHATGVTISFDKLREAASGLIPVAELVKAANLALVTGLPMQQFDELIKVGTKLGLVLGRDATDAVERLTQGIAKQETELLDELGLYARLDDAVRDYGDSIGKSSKELSVAERKTAYYYAVLDQARTKVASLSIGIGDNQMILGEMNASLRDAADTMTLWFAPAVTNLATAVTTVAKILRRDFDEPLTEVMSTLQDLTGEVDKYSRALDQIAKLKKLKEDIDASNLSFEEQNRLTKEAQFILNWFDINLPGISILFGENWKEGIAAATAELEKHNKAGKEARDVQLSLVRGELPKTLDKLTKDFDFLTRAVEAVSKAKAEAQFRTGGLSEETFKLIGGIERESRAFEGFWKLLTDQSPINDALGAIISSHIRVFGLMKDTPGVLKGAEIALASLTTAYRINQRQLQSVIPYLGEVYLRQQEISSAEKLFYVKGIETATAALEALLVSERELVATMEEGGKSGREAAETIIKTFGFAEGTTRKLLAAYDKIFSKVEEQKKAYNALKEVLEIVGLDYAALIEKLAEYPDAAKMRESLKLSIDINKSDVQAAEVALDLAKLRERLLLEATKNAGIDLKTKKDFSKEEFKLIDALYKAKLDISEREKDLLEKGMKAEEATAQKQRDLAWGTEFTEIGIQREHIGRLEKFHAELIGMGRKNAQVTIDLESTLASERRKLRELETKEEQKAWKDRYDVEKKALDDLGGLIEKAETEGQLKMAVEMLLPLLPEDERKKTEESFDKLMTRLQGRGEITTSAITSAWRETATSIVTEFLDSLSKEEKATEKYGDLIKDVRKDLFSRNISQIKATLDEERRTGKVVNEINTLTNNLKRLKSLEAHSKIREDMNKLLEASRSAGEDTAKIISATNQFEVTAAKEKDSLLLEIGREHIKKIRDLKSEEAFEKMEADIKEIEDEKLKDRLLTELAEKRTAYLAKLEEKTLSQIRRARTLDALSKNAEDVSEIKDATIKTHAKEAIAEKATAMMKKITEDAAKEIEKLAAGELEKQLWRADKRYEREKDNIDKQIEDIQELAKEYESGTDDRLIADAHVLDLQGKLNILAIESAKEREETIANFRKQAVDGYLQLEQKYLGETRKNTVARIDLDFDETKNKLENLFLVRETEKASTIELNKIRQDLADLEINRSIARKGMEIGFVNDKRNLLVSLGRLTSTIAKALAKEETELVKETGDLRLSLLSDEEDINKTRLETEKALADVKDKTNKGVEDSLANQHKWLTEAFSVAKALAAEFSTWEGNIGKAGKAASNLFGTIEDISSLANSLTSTFGTDWAWGIATVVTIAGKMVNSVIEFEEERQRILEEGREVEKRETEKWTSEYQNLFSDALTKGWEEGWDAIDWGEILKTFLKAKIIEQEAEEIAKQFIKEVGKPPIGGTPEELAAWQIKAGQVGSRLIGTAAGQLDAYWNLLENIEVPSITPDTLGWKEYKDLEISPYEEDVQIFPVQSQLASAFKSMESHQAEISYNTSRTANLLEQLVGIAEEGGSISINITPPGNGNGQVGDDIFAGPTRDVGDEVVTRRNMIALLRQKERSRGRIDRGFTSRR